MIYLKQTRIITLDILYYMPDRPSIVQEFIWQTEDHIPELFRVHKFLNYWKDNIDAVIKEILMSGLDQNGPTRFSNIDDIISIN